MSKHCPRSKHCPQSKHCPPTFQSIGKPWRPFMRLTNYAVTHLLTGLDRELPAIGRSIRLDCQHRRIGERSILERQHTAPGHPLQ